MNKTIKNSGNREELAPSSEAVVTKHEFGVIDVQRKHGRDILHHKFAEALTDFNGESLSYKQKDLLAQLYENSCNNSVGVAEAWSKNKEALKNYSWQTEGGKTKLRHNTESADAGLVTSGYNSGVGAIGVDGRGIGAFFPTAMFPTLRKAIGQTVSYAKGLVTVKAINNVNSSIVGVRLVNAQMGDENVNDIKALFEKRNNGYIQIGGAKVVFSGTYTAAVAASDGPPAVEAVSERITINSFRFYGSNYKVKDDVIAVSAAGATIYDVVDARLFGTDKITISLDGADAKDIDLVWDNQAIVQSIKDVMAVNTTDTVGAAKKKQYTECFDARYIANINEGNYDGVAEAGLFVSGLCLSGKGLTNSYALSQGLFGPALTDTDPHRRFTDYKSDFYAPGRAEDTYLTNTITNGANTAALADTGSEHGNGNGVYGPYGLNGQMQGLSTRAEVVTCQITDKSMRSLIPRNILIDLKASMGIDIIEMISDQSAELSARQLDMDIVTGIIDASMDISKGGSRVKTLDLDSVAATDLTGDWLMKKLTSLVVGMNLMSAEILNKTCGLGEGDFAIVNPQIACLLKSSGSFYNKFDYKMNSKSPLNPGSIGDVEIFTDIWRTPVNANTALSANLAPMTVGLKAKNEGESGVIAAVLTMGEIIVPEKDTMSLITAVHVLNRWDVVTSVFEAGSFYNTALIDGATNLVFGELAI